MPVYHSLITVNFKSASNPTELALGVADIVLADSLGSQPKPRAAAPAAVTQADEFEMPLAQLRPYVGRYVSRELGVTYVVGIRDGRLYVSLPERWDRSVTPTGEDAMRDEERGLRFGFQRDARGSVSGFRLDAGQAANALGGAAHHQFAGRETQPNQAAEAGGGDGVSLDLSSTGLDVRVPLVAGDLELIRSSY